MKTFKQFLYEEENLTYTKTGSQLGSNPGGIHMGSNGKQYYIKHYANADQAKVEALTGKIYDHLGIKTLKPEYVKINGKPSIRTEWNPNLEQMDPKEFKNLNPSQQDDIAKMFHGAVLTKNWDVVGLVHDNIVRDRNSGDLYSVDQGGSFHFRAQGGPKDYDPNIGEHESLVNSSGAAGDVFGHMMRNHPESVNSAIDKVAQIDDNHIYNLFQNSGLANWQDLHKNFMERKEKLLDRYR